VKKLTIDERGDAYMPMVNPAHKIPTNVSCKLSSWIARRVIAITNPRRPTFNMATVFAVLI
jgi:hypothetical protein